MNEQEPLDPLFDMRQDSPDTPPAEPQPTGPQPPEAPRLGILHLLVLTACVAVYMGITQSLERGLGSFGWTGFETGIFRATTRAVQAIGGGAALAGLVLWIARRRRGMRFPVHPGEFLLLLIGTLVAFRLLKFVLAMTIWPFDATGPGWTLFAVILGLAPLAVLGALWLWAVIKIKIRRWRAYLWLLLGANVAPALLGGVWMFAISLYVYAAIRGVVIVALLGVAVLDHGDGKRYPWPHWFGVATKLSFDLIELGSMADFFLLPAVVT